MAKTKTKTKPARYKVVTCIGNHAVREVDAERIIALCTRRSDALLITKALNRT